MIKGSSEVYTSMLRIFGSPSNECHRAMDVREHWMSDSNGYHRAKDVTEKRMPQSNGCQNAMDVRQQWMSQSKGCHRATDFTEHCMSQRTGCQKAANVREQWMSECSGCHIAMDVSRESSFFVSFDEGLARKFLFHIFNFPFVEKVSHARFLFTRIFNFQFWREV